MFKLILIFTVIPLIELTLLIRLSYHVGTLYTISLIATTGIIGAILAKKQGTSVVKKINQSLSQGEMPADSLIDGLLILIGSAMLVTPGLLTDFAGFSCIIPFTRKRVKFLMKGKLRKLITTGRVQFFSFNQQEEKTVDIVDNEKTSN
ncbi:FxsA protein [Orenia metallireducens]|uniref:FxsA protein n=1 Tax=Orenia metallireducens TaxID=1413210 RepID=A0A1C0A791_9FIRM|nr:FxsA family protein [Orenia metallireducens]OCL26117.1 FxsA protein [Orenia metallireducens]